KSVAGRTSWASLRSTRSVRRRRSGVPFRSNESEFLQSNPKSDGAHADMSGARRSDHEKWPRALPLDSSRAGEAGCEASRASGAIRKELPGRRTQSRIGRLDRAAIHARGAAARGLPIDANRLRNAAVELAIENRGRVACALREARERRRAGGGAAAADVG